LLLLLLLLLLLPGGMEASENFLSYYIFNMFISSI
jgi:hypothetical protein